MVFLLACNNEAKKDDAAATELATTETKQQPTEFADAKHAAVGKDFLANMSSGNMDAWGNSLPIVVWQWNNGDSIAGKTAVLTYWKDRRSNAIDSISFSNDIWLPVKVNQPQQTEQAGVWLLGWYQIKAKYKTGKSMSQWSHIDYHFDANDKVDKIIQYLDRAPINEAMKK